MPEENVHSREKNKTNNSSKMQNANLKIKINEKQKFWKNY